jgi:Transposase DNA-binding/Transposase Tn5 dimerisation domain
MALTADVMNWAKENFGAVKLGDPRRTRRLVHSAAKIAEHPEKSFTQVFDWNELRGFYNLCDQQQATLQAVQAAHRQATRQAMASLPLVLIAHDTTTLDFTTHEALTGQGPIGNGEGTGFLQHNSLAFTPDGQQLLGLSYQQLYVRQPAPAKETRRARKKRDRESLLWLEGIRAPGKPPEGSVWVDMGDRGADIYEAMEAADEVDHEFLFRVCQDRIVFADAEHTREVKLKAYARSLAAAGEDVVEVPGRGGRPARQARVKLAAAPVWVPAPRTAARRKSRPVLACWVVRVWEVDAPKEVKEPLEWILLSSVETVRLEQMKQRRDWYTVRWGAEVYHDVEKNGCSEEDRRFETAERMAACLAVLAVVAVRVYQLRLAVEHMPAAPAAQVATAEEVEVLKRHTASRFCDWTVRDFVFAVAKLGGFLGRKRDGLPGVRSLWRGYQRLQDMVVGYRLQRLGHYKTSA